MLSLLPGAVTSEPVTAPGLSGSSGAVELPQRFGLIEPIPEPEARLCPAPDLLSGMWGATGKDAS